MYAGLPKICCGFFERVCLPSNATAHFRDPPPPRNTKTGALAGGSGPKRITSRATVDGALAGGRRRPPLYQCQGIARMPPSHHAACRTHAPQSIANRATPETLPPVVRRLPGLRVEEEPVGIPAVREVEQILEASGLRVEGLIAYPAESPVILDKA